MSATTTAAASATGAYLGNKYGQQSVPEKETQ